MHWVYLDIIITLMFWYTRLEKTRCSCFVSIAFDLKWTQKKNVKMEQQTNFSWLASLVRSLIAVLQFSKCSTVNLPTDQELFSYHLGFQIFALTSAISISWKIPTMPKFHTCLTLQGFAFNFIILHQAVKPKKYVHYKTISVIALQNFPNYSSLQPSSDVDCFTQIAHHGLPDETESRGGSIRHLGGTRKRGTGDLVHMGSSTLFT